IDYNVNSTNLLAFSYSARKDINDGKVGIPAGTVMSRLSRARERLRALMSGTKNKSIMQVVK
ncbi:MAG: hypothetical protein ABL931_16330, partial [Usitatibacteraceae bacterium]